MDETYVRVKGPAAAVSAAVRPYIQQQPILYVKAAKIASQTGGVHIHAHDCQRADEIRWQNQAICSPAVLLASDVSNPYHIAFFHHNRLTATKPFHLLSPRDEASRQVTGDRGQLMDVLLQHLDCMRRLLATLGSSS